MTQVLDLPEVVNYGAEKFIQLYVDKCIESPGKSSPEEDVPKEVQNIQPEINQAENIASFGLFGQRYKMKFSQKSNIYQCLDRRLKSRGNRSITGAPGDQQ